MKRLFFLIIALTVVLFSCKEDPVTPPDEPIILENLDDYSIAALSIDGANTLWVATDDGLYKAVTDGYLAIDLGMNMNVTALGYESASNTVWAGTNAGLYEVKLGETEIAGNPISSELLSDNHILTAYINENTDSWFGTKVGFTRNEGENWQKENFKRNILGEISDLDFSDEAITSIGIWNGNYFFATAGNKVWRANDWRESVDAFTSATQWDPPYNGDAITDTMYAVFIDSRGFQWFGGIEGVQVHTGIDPDNYNPKSENYSFKAELVNEIVRCIAEAPNGDIWCGTENGISIGSFSSELGFVWNASIASLSNNFVTSIIFEGNTAWVGTKMGLNKIDL